MVAPQCPQMILEYEFLRARVAFLVHLWNNCKLGTLRSTVVSNAALLSWILPPRGRYVEAGFDAGFAETLVLGEVWISSWVLFNAVLLHERLEVDSQSFWDKTIRRERRCGP